MNEESLWLNEEKKPYRSKKMISHMSASDVSRGLVWFTNNLKHKNFMRVEKQSCKLRLYLLFTRYLDLL